MTLDADALVAKARRLDALPENFIRGKLDADGKVKQNWRAYVENMVMWMIRWHR